MSTLYYVYVDKSVSMLTYSSVAGNLSTWHVQVLSKIVSILAREKYGCLSFVKVQGEEMSNQSELERYWTKLRNYAQSFLKLILNKLFNDFNDRKFCRERLEIYIKAVAQCMNP